MKLINSFPKLNDKLLAKIENILEKRFDYTNK